jgi:hypothetical protein
MKIKTITCHDVYNYGASLQAYALLHFLNISGHNVEIIDYLPNKNRRRYDYFRLASTGFLRKVADLCPFSEPFLALWQNRWEILGRKRKLNFDKFKCEYLKCTELKYTTFSDLKNNKPSADFFVAGSDQIWNVSYGNGLDPAFYCAFEDDCNKRISYAASFGSSTIPEESVDFIKKMLSRFKAISVRETSGVKIINSLGLDAFHVLDPVFLLEKEVWSTLCRKSENKNYVLVYDFLHNDPTIEYVAKQLAKKYKLKIVSLNDFKPLLYADENVNNAGPIEFLEYVKNAGYVISSSFHATAFSVIFSREFYTFPLVGHGNSARMEDFLGMLGLSDRFIHSEDSFVESSDIDYKQVDQIINEKRNLSRNWLLDQLKY